MTWLTASILLAVELGGGFGSATATVVSTTQQSMIVEVHVTVDGDPSSVVAHFALPGEDQVTIPLLPRDDEGFGVRTELKKADYQVVFEAIGDDPGVSDPVVLSDLGAEIEGDDQASEGEDSPDPATQRWLWLGVALGAASLSALAFWVLGGRDDRDRPEEAGEARSVEEPAPSPEDEAE
jgi:hypothetical protein